MTQPDNATTAKGLLLAAGITGDETEDTTVKLTLNQIVDDNAVVAFELSLSKGDENVSEPEVPVTVTFTFPSSFTKDNTKTYQIIHSKNDGTTSDIPLAINGNAQSGYTGTFTTPSFSSFAVVAEDIQPTGITLDHTSLSLKVGNQKQLTANIVPENAANKTVTWTSSNPAVATVSNGVVAAIKVGTTTITAKTANGITATCTVTVVSASSSHHGGGGGGNNNDDEHESIPTKPSSPSTPSQTFVSDTTNDLTVNGTYQFRITSKNGKTPVFVVGTSGVFDVKLASTTGNDYFFKITAIGAPGDKAGIYINGGSRFLVATVGSNPNYAKLDTGKQLSVKAGKTYQFKVTAAKRPSFVCGTGSTFRVAYAGSKGNDYFFKVTATGKVGDKAGFYVNGEKAPRTIGTIVK